MDTMPYTLKTAGDGAPLPRRLAKLLVQQLARVNAEVQPKWARCLEEDGFSSGMAVESAHSYPATAAVTRGGQRPSSSPS